MDVLALFGLALLAAIALWFSARRAISVAVIDVRDGQLRVTYGGLAPRALSDLGDVLSHPPVRHATVRILRSAGSPRVEIKGTLSSAQVQQVRNVIGSIPLAQLSNYRRSSSKPG